MTGADLLSIVKDPILMIERSGLVVDLHVNDEVDLAIVDLQLLGKKIQHFDFLRDLYDCVIQSIDDNDSMTTYFSYVYGAQLKHYEVLVEPKDGERAIALIKEVTKKKQRENELLDYADLIQNIYKGTASWTGHAYLDHLTIQLGKALKSDCTAIFLLDDSKTTLKTVSICDNGVISKNQIGKRDSSPFDIIASNGLLEIRSGFEKQFPDFFMLKDRQLTGIVAVPVFYNQFINKPIGMMAAMYTEAPESFRQVDKILSIFSTRAATELERMENLKKLEKSEQKFRALYNNTPALFNSISNEGVVIEVGDFFLEKTGYLREEVVGQSCFQFVTQKSLAYAISKVLPKFKRQGFCKDVPLQCKKKNGEVLDVLFSATIVKGEDGVFEKIVTNLNDVTELRRIENELKEREARVVEAANRYQSLFDNSPVGIIIHSNGIIKHVNSEAIRLAKGATIFDFIGKEAMSFVHPDSKKVAQERISNIYNTKLPHRNEQKFICVDGSIIEVEAMGTLVEYDGVPAVQIAFYDISERKEAQRQILENDEKLKGLNDHLAKQNGQLEEFAHIASHNLRAPITNMMSLMKIKDDDPSPENEAFVWENIRKTIINLDETIVELNDVVKTSWELDKERRMLNIQGIIDKILESIGQEIKELKADIQVNLDEMPSIYYPKVYLESILQNLITNALKYRSQDRIPLVKVTAFHKEGIGYLTVEDNGLGIDLEKFGSKLFGLRKTFHENADARGVGLFITRAQVESMGGEISVESTVGKGSIFKITFGEL
ncbi:PAS domain S-box protein [Reichenbachiella versicolor]|uniref:PAS domain S-box protein n=1 Tax=Reichenbachiella versicolor TaxID=1821036 RepID=UPI000D6E9BE8|nr:PAS domain S-box protein [Reichenbachiella versicolor]